MTSKHAPVVVFILGTQRVLALETNFRIGVTRVKNFVYRVLSCDYLYSEQIQSENTENVLLFDTNPDYVEYFHKRASTYKLTILFSWIKDNLILLTWSCRPHL